MLFGVQHDYAIGEELQFATEVGDAKDRYAISVLQGSDVLGHLPQYFAQAAAGISYNNVTNVTQI